MTGAPLLAAIFPAALLIATATPARALPILDPPDAEELAAELAEATAVQGICYGWKVTVHDEETGSTTVDAGSSRGVGAVDDPSCRRRMIFEADLTYTPSDSESEDSASFWVTSNIGGAPYESELRRVGITGEDLLGSKDDLAVINATLALPALAAEMGLAPPLPLEPNAEGIPPADGPTGQPGSDWTRSFGHFVLLAVVLVLGGLGWAGWAWAAERYGWHTDDGDDA